MRRGTSGMRVCAMHSKCTEWLDVIIHFVHSSWFKRNHYRMLRHFPRNMHHFWTIINDGSRKTLYKNKSVGIATPTRFYKYLKCDFILMEYGILYGEQRSTQFGCLHPKISFFLTEICTLNRKYIKFNCNFTLIFKHTYVCVGTFFYRLFCRSQDFWAAF